MHVNKIAKRNIKLIKFTIKACTTFYTKIHKILEICKKKTKDLDKKRNVLEQACFFWHFNTIKRRIP